jgi:hypothetical protein
VSVGFAALLPTATAQPYGGSVSIGDNSNPPILKDYFDLWENVYYYVNAIENVTLGTPLQYKDIDIEIIDPQGNLEHWNMISTDAFGNAEGWWTGIGTPDKYTIYANYTGINLVNTTFRVYDPIPQKATVMTYANDYRDSGGIPATYFNSNDWVYFSIYVEDQYGNPFNNDGQVFTEIEHNGDINSEWWWDEYTNSEAYIDESYYPNGDFDTDELYGSYFINVTNQIDESIGNATFIVVDVDIDIIPDKPQYVQSDKITLIVDTSIDDTIDVRILDPDGIDLIGANWTNQPIVNGQWTKEYTFGANLPDGNYEIQILKDGNIMEMQTITLRKFNLKIWTDNSAYLPGETMKVFYTITNNKDGSGVTDATLDWIFEFYDIDATKWDFKENTISTPGAQGSFSIPIPKSAYKNFDGDLWAWANDTQDHSSNKFRNVEIGGISASLNIQENEYLAGDFVTVDISAHVNGGDLKYGNVAFEVLKEGEEIVAYTKNNLRTDIRGDLSYVFVLQSSAEEGIYTININITKDGTDEWDIAQDTFEVVSEREMSIEMSFDNKYSTGTQPQYYSGDTVTVTYTIYKGDSVVTGLNCEYSASYGSNVIKVGTTSSGQFSFDIPSDFQGTITVSVECTDSQGTKIHESDSISVLGTGILLNPSSTQYIPGDTIKIQYRVVGTDVPNSLFYIEIWDNHGNIIKRENVASGDGTYKFTVPEGDPPDNYYVGAIMTDSNGVVITENSVTLTKIKGFLVTFTMDKNTYRPGETATLHYKVISLDGSDIPEKFTLSYSFFGMPSNYKEVSKSEGDVKLKIPEDIPDGEGLIYMSSSLPSTTMASQQADIRESPNPLAETVGDMSLFEILLLILVTIALIFGIGAWRRGKKAMDEAKLPPWKKDGPLPEPEKFKDTEAESMPEPEAPPAMPDEPAPPEDMGPEPL